MKPTALVVDKNFFFIEYLSKILIHRGYGVIRAYDGREAIERLQEFTVDVIFTELLLPKISGAELIAFARDYLADKSVPLILISGALIEKMDRLHTIGADYYIAKGPFEKTARHIHGLLDKLRDKQPPSLTEVIIPRDIFPRQDTIDLMQTVDFYHAIFESTDAGLLVLDRDARIIKINHRAGAIFQLSLKDILLQHGAMLFPEKDRKQFIMVLKEVARQRELGKMTFPTTVEGRPILALVACLYLDSQQQGWIVAIIENVRSSVT